MLIHPRVELLKSLAEIALQQNLMIGLPAKRSIFAELFCVIGIYDIPSQFVMQKVSRTVLHKDVFRIIIAHTGAPLYLNLSAHKLGKQTITSFTQFFIDL